MKSGRRSFVKGSVAAPLVLTVGPAAARAQSSTLMCLARDEQRAKSGTPKPAAMIAVDADDWLRIQVDLFALNIWQGQELKAVDGKHFLGVDKTTYWRLDESVFGRPSAAPTAYNTSNCTARKLGERRFGLVYVDQRGGRTGYAFEKNGGNPVTASCWTSVAVFRA